MCEKPSSSSSKYIGRRTNHPLCPDRKTEVEFFFIVKLHELKLSNLASKALTLGAVTTSFDKEFLGLTTQSLTAKLLSSFVVVI